MSFGPDFSEEPHGVGGYLMPKYWSQVFATQLAMSFALPAHHLTNATGFAKVPVSNNASSMEIDVTEEIHDQLVFFASGEMAGVEADKTILGGKGAGLVEMAKLGLPVPPGVIIPTKFCKNFLENTWNPENYPIHELAKEIGQIVRGVMSVKLGMSGNVYPMVSVRSGARVSMPGMMDTILNVGISKQTLPYWMHKIGPRAAMDSYRRLIQMYGVTAMDINPKYFQSAMKEVMQSKYGHPTTPKSENSLSIKHLEKLIEKYEAVYVQRTGEAFPQTLEEQLLGAISAVFNSWNSERAIEYRKIHGIPNDWYTACVVQTMVLGNLDDQSCSGVMFSRDFNDGSKHLIVDWLPNAQGEEVVSGSADPFHLDTLGAWNVTLPDELQALATQLEGLKNDMVDVEFTVQSGKLFVLQYRTGKRTAQAAFKIAYDLVQEGKISKQEALKRVTGEQYVTISKPVIDPTFKEEPIAVGIPGSKGIATGRAWFTSEKAQKNPGGILVSKETTPDDFPGMAQSAGILTQTGGATSHAAVVARGMDKACVVGCTGIKFDGDTVFVGLIGVKEGDEITIDGATGRVWAGKVPMVGGLVPSFVNEMIEWGVGAAMTLKYRPSKDELPMEGEVYIDCSELTTPTDVVTLIAFLNGARPKLTGILSFVNEAGFDDSKMLSFLCLPTKQTGMTTATATELAKCFHKAVDIKGRWTVVGAESFFGQFHKPVNFKVHRPVKTLGEFMHTDGYYEVHADLQKLMQEQGLKVEEFAALLTKAGKTVKPLTKAVSRESMAFAVFGK